MAKIHCITERRFSAGACAVRLQSGLLGSRDREPGLNVEICHPQAKRRSSKNHSVRIRTRSARPLLRRGRFGAAA
jgi:hypothetical protein